MDHMFWEIIRYLDAHEIGVQTKNRRPWVEIAYDELVDLITSVCRQQAIVEDSKESDEELEKFDHRPHQGG